MQGPGALWGDASFRLGVRLTQDHFVGGLIWVVVVVVVFTSGWALSIGLDSIGGWMPVSAARRDVSMMIPTMGEQGLMVCSEVVAGGSIARRFLESWPKTFVAGRPPLLTCDERLFW